MCSHSGKRILDDPTLGDSKKMFCLLEPGWCYVTKRFGKSGSWRPWLIFSRMRVSEMFSKVQIPFWLVQTFGSYLCRARSWRLSEATTRSCCSPLFRSWLVVWLPFSMFPSILGMSSSQLTKSIIFQRGGLKTHQPGSLQRVVFEDAPPSSTWPPRIRWTWWASLGIFGSNFRVFLQKVKGQESHCVALYLIHWPPSFFEMLHIIFLCFGCSPSGPFLASYYIIFAKKKRPVHHVSDAFHMFHQRFASKTSSVVHIKIPPIPSFLFVSLWFHSHDGLPAVLIHFRWGSYPWNRHHLAMTMETHKPY